MSTATVTYHELPPLNSWISESTTTTVSVGQDNTTAGSGGGGSGASSSSPFLLGANNGNGGDQSSAAAAASHYDSPSWTPFRSGSHEDDTLWSMSPAFMPPPPPYSLLANAFSPNHNNSNSNNNSMQSDFRSTTIGKKRSLTTLRTASTTTNGTNANANNNATVMPSSTASLGSSTAPEELCLVCGDKASGYHYNALTCEGCKGFFRRSITRKAVYYCKYGGSCDIDMYMRRKCQCCRLRKCMDIGMRPERLRPDSRLPLVVIPEDQCRIKREAKQKMRNLATTSSSTAERKSSSPQQVTSTDSSSLNDASTTTRGLTLEQQELVNRLLTSQQQFDMPTDVALSKLSTFGGVKFAHNKTEAFQHLAELTILYVQLNIDFTKHLPGFSNLSADDKLTLQKACASEVLMLRTARQYDAKTDTIIMGNQCTSWAYNRDAYRQAVVGAPTDAIFDFAKSMSKLRVDNAEYALLTAIAIFSDRPGLIDAKKVEDIQEVYTSTLQAYIDVHRPKNRTVFARLLMKLTDLRTLGSEKADMLCALKIAEPMTVRIKQEQQQQQQQQQQASSSAGWTNGYEQQQQQQYHQQQHRFGNVNANNYSSSTSSSASNNSDH